MEPIKIEAFGGMIPRMDERLLPPYHAARSENTDLSRGTIRGLHLPLRLNSFPDNTKFVFRIPYGATFAYILSDRADTDVVVSPVTQDSFDRYYWTDDTNPPRYNTLDRIFNEDPAFTLGVPFPPDPLTEVAPASGPDDETRIYVYTFVTDYGEESAPSPPAAAATGAGSGQWQISDIADPVGGTPSHYQTKRLYRTVTGDQGADFYFVADIPFGTTTYQDNILSADVVLNDTLESTNWLPPIATLKGLVSMPNGILAGFSGKDIWFSEPYRPHAWPDEYVITVGADVVGLAVVGTTLLVATRSAPYAITGVAPEVMTATKFDVVEPCTSKRSIVPFTEYALYTSENGLVAIYPNDAKIFSAPFIDRDTWREKYIGNKQIQACRYRDNQYLAYVPEGKSFLVHTEERQQLFQEIYWDFPVDNLRVDYYSGVALTVYNDNLYQFNPSVSYRYAAVWKSKKFDLPEPKNLGFLHIKFLPAPDETVPQSLIDDAEAYNVARIAYPLQPVGWHPVGRVRKVDLGGTPFEALYGQTKQPVGGTPLIDINSLRQQSYTGTVYVYADNKLVFQKELGQPIFNKFRLPSGFKATYWQIEYIGTATIASFTLAEHGRDLARA